MSVLVPTVHPEAHAREEFLDDGQPPPPWRPGDVPLRAYGAALHHLRVGLAVRGWAPVLRLDLEGPPQRRVAEVGWEPEDAP